MCYDLRQGNFVRAEESLWKIEDPPAKLASELMLVKACIYLRRGLNQRALAIIEDLIQGNKFTPLHNTFMSFLYTFYFDRPKLGKKYFAVSVNMIAPIVPLYSSRTFTTISAVLNSFALLTCATVPVAGLKVAAT